MWYRFLIKTPVIIAAYNEEQHIAATLRSLPADRVEPIVAVNGSDDRTAVIAESFGSEVIVLPERGKLPAIQVTLKHLGKRALNPLLILDADNRPIFPKHWHDGMVRSLSNHTNSAVPEAVAGPVWFTEGPIVDQTLRSMLRVVKAIRTRSSTYAPEVGQAGPNMGLHLKNNEALEAILSLPHYWPSEDKAMIAVVMSDNGHFSQPIRPTLATLNPLSESFLQYSEIRRIGRDEARRRMYQHYEERGASGSQPFISR